MDKRVMEMEKGSVSRLSTRTIESPNFRDSQREQPNRLIFAILKNFHKFVRSSKQQFIHFHLANESNRWCSVGDLLVFF